MLQKIFGLKNQTSAAHLVLNSISIPSQTLFKNPNITRYETPCNTLQKYLHCKELRDLTCLFLIIFSRKRISVQLLSSNAVKKVNNGLLIAHASGDEIENSEESEYFSPQTPNNNGGASGSSSYRYPRNSTPNGRERKRVLR